MTEEVRFIESVIAIDETAGGVTFKIKVQPRASRNMLAGELGDALKVKLTAPPADGRANQACIEFFSGLLGVPKASVSIVSGQTSRRKMVHVSGITSAQLRQRLEL